MHIRIENDLGRQEDFPDCLRFKVLQDGSIEVKHIKAGHDDHVTVTETFGPEWEVVQGWI